MLFRPPATKQAVSLWPGRLFVWSCSSDGGAVGSPGVYAWEGAPSSRLPYTRIRPHVEQLVTVSFDGQVLEDTLEP